MLFPDGNQEMSRVCAMTFCSVVTASSCCCFPILSSFHGRLLWVALPRCSMSGSWLEDPLEWNAGFAVLNRLYLSQLHLTHFLKYCIPLPFLTRLQHLLCVSEFRLLKEALQVNVLLRKRYFLLLFGYGAFCRFVQWRLNPQEKKRCSIAWKGISILLLAPAGFKCWDTSLGSKNTTNHVVCCLSRGKKIELWKTARAPATEWGPVPYWGPADGV